MTLAVGGNLNPKSINQPLQYSMIIGRLKGLAHRRRTGIRVELQTSQQILLLCVELDEPPPIPFASCRKVWNKNKTWRSFKSSEHVNEKEDGPYSNFGYLSLFSDPIDLATWSQKE